MFRANKHKLSWKLFSERKFVLVLLRRCFCISLSGLFAHEKRRKREKNTRKTHSVLENRCTKRKAKRVRMTMECKRRE